MMNVVRWIIGALLLAFFTICTVGNWTLLIGFYRKGKRGTFAHFLGGLAGCIGLLIIPVTGTYAWCWVPLLVDPGCFLWLRYPYDLWNRARSR